MHTYLHLSVCLSVYLYPSFSHTHHSFPSFLSSQSLLFPFTHPPFFLLRGGTASPLFNTFLLKSYSETRPFITAHPQTVSSMVIDTESVTKGGGRKCCFNNLGLKHILLYASKGFNNKKKKSTCRDIFSWLKQQSEAYKCSPTIMTYL